MVKQVILSEQGHTGDLIWRNREAFAHMATTYYDSGEVDDSKFNHEPMNFKAEMSFPYIAKTAVAILAGITLILSGIVYLIIRIIRRKRRKMVSALIQLN